MVPFYEVSTIGSINFVIIFSSRATLTRASNTGYISSRSANYRTALSIIQSLILW